MRLYQMADAVRYEMMNTEELRETFLLEGMFQPGEIEFAYVDLDRTVIGSAVPESEALTLETEPELRAEYFLERRQQIFLIRQKIFLHMAHAATTQLVRLRN